MANKSIVNNEKLNALAQEIAAKSGASLPMTVDEMTQAVSEIPEGGGDDLLTIRTAGEPYTYTNDEITVLPAYAFYYDGCLTEIRLGEVINLEEHVFDSCESLTQVDAPNLETIGDYAFAFCIGLSSIDLDNVTSVGMCSFGCMGPEAVPEITEFVMPKCWNVFDFAFCGNADEPYTTYWPMTKLDIGTEGVNRSAYINKGALFALNEWAAEQGGNGTLIIRFNRCAVLQNDSLSNYPNVTVYVPDSLVASYQTDSGWEDAPNQIKGLSELPA